MKIIINSLVYAGCFAGLQSVQTHTITTKGDEPYYPVNDEKNGALYAEYKKLADAEPDVIFGGRLGEYKYYDMDKVIEVALDVAAKELA